MFNKLCVAVAIGVAIGSTVRADTLDSLKTKAASAAQRIKQMSSQGASKASQFASASLDKAKSGLSSANTLLTRAVLKPFPHHNEVVSVRAGVAIGTDEVAFRSAREPIIRIGIGKLLGRPVTEARLPTIGLCMSGGGYRAMLLSMAFMGGLQKLGMIDASMYAAALSGSTWSLLYWLASGKTSRGSLNTLIETAGRGQILPPLEWGDVINTTLTKKSYGETITVVDVWGAYLVEQILSDVAGQQNYVFSQLAQRVASGQVPFPIGTAVSDNIIGRSTEYQWFEATPFEFGSVALNGWIPIWAAGRKFENGVSQNAVPEQTLGFWMGVFGSAFSLSIGDIIDKAPGVVDSKSLQAIMKSVTPIKKQVGAKRIVEGAQIPNFAYKFASAPDFVRNVKTLELVDAGISCNLPAVPLLRPERRLDIIIMCDASHPVVGGAELKCVQDYARINNLKFPAIDYRIVGTQNISVFGNPSDPNSLVIMYIPRKSNSSLPQPYGSLDMDAAASITGFAGTVQFKYSRQNAELMTGYFEQNIIEQKKIIQDVVALRLKALNQ